MERRVDATSLLSWATANMDTSKPPQPRVFDPIEKKIIAAMLKPDADKMKFLIKVLVEKEFSLEEKEAALEELQFYVEQQENANDLHHPSINGLVPLLEALRSNHAGLRSRAAWVLATMVQNNTKSQANVLDCRGVGRFEEALKWEVSKENAGDLEVLGKLIFAISGLLTYQPKAQKEFWSLGGFSHLIAILNMGPEQLENFRNYKEPIEAPSGKLPEPVITSPKEDSKSDDSSNKTIVGAIEVVEEEDKVRDVSLRIRKEKEQKQQQLSMEEIRSLWIKLCSKVVFFLFKMMNESEQFKLAFVKDKEGNIIKILLKLLEQENEYLDLKEKILITLETISTSTNQTVKNYIIQILKQPQLEMVNILTKQKNNIMGHLKQDGDEYGQLILQKINNLLTLLHS